MRTQVHLKEVQAAFGTGEATEPVRKLLEYGLKKQLEKEKAQRKAEGKEFREYPYVSEAGKCPRALYFALSNVPKSEPLTLDSWMTMNIGKKAEELYIQLLEAAGVKILTQERVELEAFGTKVVGKLDLLIEFTEEVRSLIPGLDPVELWELKTKNSRAMGFMLKQGGPGKDDGYRKQVNLYLEGADRGLYQKPTQARGRLIYTAVGATKGEPLFHAWFVPYDVSEAMTDTSLLSHVWAEAQAGRDPGVPAAFAEKPNWPCGYCDYRSHCRSTACQK